ncbi:MAG: DUF2085 domain-containing protein [Bacteroidota bacterium]
MKKDIIILYSILFLWNAGIIAAPVAAILTGAQSLVSEILYSFYHPVCHQFASHSFSIAGNKFAVCERCTAIYFSFFFGVAAAGFFPMNRLRQIPPIWILMCASLPMMLDGVLPWVTVYEPEALSRTASGALFGFGLSLLLRQSLIEIISYIGSTSRKRLYGIKSR